MLDTEKERIKERAEKLSQMNPCQLLILKAFQDGLIAGQKIEQEKANKV